MQLVWSILFCYLVHVKFIRGTVDEDEHAPTIVELNDTTFASTVSKGLSPWMVLIFAGNSTFGQSALEDFFIAANVLKVIYRFGYIDYHGNRITVEMFKIIVYDDATLFIFGDDRLNPRVILQAGSSWETSHFVKEGLAAFHNMLFWRLENYNTDKKPKKKPQDLTEQTFLEAIGVQEYSGTYSPWLVLFYSDDNLESKILQGLFEIVSAELFPMVRTAKIDVATQRNLTQKMFDQVFLPTVMFIGKRSRAEVYTNPVLPMSQMPTVGHICNFALSERLIDLSTFENHGVSAVMLSVGDLPYNDAKIIHFNANTTLHLFSRL